jgi:hypothetical protein
MDNKAFRIAIIALSIFALGAGAFGMLFCAPFLWSANMADLVGAGFPFVGASILFASGLLSLALAQKTEEK